jgi:hypothetical protein
MLFFAKAELRRHRDDVRMVPTQGQEVWHYVAEGKWDLLGTDPNVDRTRQPSDWRIQMVAGVCARHANLQRAV